MHLLTEKKMGFPLVETFTLKVFVMHDSFKIGLLFRMDCPQLLFRTFLVFSEHIHPVGHKKLHVYITDGPINKMLRF